MPAIWNINANHNESLVKFAQKIKGRTLFLSVDEIEKKLRPKLEKIMCTPLVKLTTKNV